ncbi:QacE family quaternary ammonium compound efflux SMR transporter [Halalkalibacillus sediminis]|uniref:QacE family quaternary ammonium compound efflux SMR transporter n=1 Tax=Halalkalibacillus sediminis TaxID=2018042 RepID=A0A2I0QSD2_9BACI|nr:SMR family transporter [Halalkalibacillus sediminis]PKR77247.1 QacE family quaternary ammonium compound efflux SMR transporter [Halalkalibacillus sediminis]
MNKDWIKVFVGAFFEVLWVIGLKHSDDILAWGGTAIAIFISYYLMVMAGQHLPIGTIYAVFVGLGTSGTVLAEILFFAEPANPLKLTFIGLLLIGVIGLKMVTDEQSGEDDDSCTG